MWEDDRPRLRIYIGAAPGVGKTYSMLEEAHALLGAGIDVVIGMIETYGRASTEALVKDLDIVPRRKIPYKGVVLEELDIDAIVARRPRIAVVDELAHTNAPGSRHEKRYQDVVELLDRGISVMTAVNIQHLETLNDAVSRVTGVRVRETVPDTFLDRADEVINVDTTVEELQARLRRDQVYKPEKIEQALANFFRAGNLSALRELALRAVADEVGDKAASLRQLEGLEPALIPERVMVCMSSASDAPRVIRTGARIARRLGARWYAVYVETPREAPGRIPAGHREALARNMQLAEGLGATVVRVTADRPADGLIAFAKREGITHVIFGQTARSRWEILLKGSVLNRFLEEVRDAAVQVAVRQLAGRLHARIRPAQHDADARQQLLGAERLGHVVFRAGVERADLLLFRVARREHDDRRAPVFADGAAHIDTVHVRQPQIQDDHVRFFARSGRDRGPA
jgi:two-component system, OmpR family, sensor histidine kinase KdpD